MSVIVRKAFATEGFFDDDENNTFGYFKKGTYMPQSNFTFEFVSEVVCESWPQSSGFLVKVKAEGSSVSRSVSYSIPIELFWLLCFLIVSAIQQMIL